MKKQYCKRIINIVTYSFVVLLAHNLHAKDSIMEGGKIYTRGIGIYPGRKCESFAPSIIPGGNEYRNIAKNRAAFASSSYDYNMTAQLLTDGLFSGDKPKYLEVYSSDGNLPRREREWMIDGGRFSRNVFEGEDVWYVLKTVNYKKTVSSVIISGKILYEEKAVSGGYEIILLGSEDDNNWTILDSICGSGLPGEKSGTVIITDPNKDTGETMLPARKISEKIELESGVSYSSYKIIMRMNGAVRWEISSTDFFLDEEKVDMKPSQYFNSCWMSDNCRKAWVYVDLGSRSMFDKIVLHWEDKPSRGSILISDDAAHWKPILDFPESDNSTVDTFTLDKMYKARYVKVDLENDIDKRLAMTELEVFGRGGVNVVPALPEKENKNGIILSGGDWKLQRASEIQETGDCISREDFDCKHWIPATVPGTVLSSYINIGAIPNPNFADNQVQISESFFLSDFWYRNEFIINNSINEGRYFLEFDGINWKAEVYMNGRTVGVIDGAFVRGKFDITELLKKGKNVIAVKIIKNDNPGSVKEKNYQSSDINGGVLGADNPTFHASVGWDWIPTIRGRNIGIWNDVRIVRKGDVTLDSPYVKTELPLPDTSKAVLTAEVFVKNHSGKTVNGKLECNIGDINVSKDVELKSGEEKIIVFNNDEYPQLNISSPNLWWPNGYGKPDLYSASFAFTVNGTLSDKKDFKVGIRQIDFTEDNDVLTLYINGRRFIPRGGNWGFSESNLNYRGREYDAAVLYHKDMNFNMIRNWVGMTGDKEFYDACDKYGIMVWQDFWLANPVDGPDPSDPEMFINNATDYVRRIRSHPSIGLYCGRNEGFPTAYIDKGLRQIINEYHSDIHYISSSADNVVSGHGPYRMLAPEEYFTMEKGADKIHSERGMPNVMSYENLLRTFSSDKAWPQNNQWGLHDYTQEGAQSCATFNSIISKGYGIPSDLKEFADFAQWVNYDGHRSLFESRSKFRQGLLMWMSHPCWPSMVWQTYDYYLEPTAAYFGIKKASEPIHIQWNQGNDTVEVVNYSAGKKINLTAKAEIYNMDGSLAWEMVKPVDIKEDSTAECFHLDTDAATSVVYFIKLKLMDGNDVISDNFYHSSKISGNFQELRNIHPAKVKMAEGSRRLKDGIWISTLTIKNESDIPALKIRLRLLSEKDNDLILPVIYSDNYFSLLPGETRVITLKWRDEDTRGGREKISLSWYNMD